MKFTVSSDAFENGRIRGKYGKQSPDCKEGVP